MVLERFLNPSLLTYPNDSRVLDEYTYLKYYRNNPDMVQRLKDHWDTWLTEEHIANLSRIGFTHARVPVGNRTFIYRLIFF